INKDHVVTHWNKALEKLTGHTAREIVGTNQQWKPFRSKERPIMADVILDQLEAGEINKYYIEWRPSNLIEEAYEAEEFFPNLGKNGTWCFFTAAPIKDPDGNIIGAIETLWDTTEARRAVEERERHTRELAQIIQGSTIPTFVINKDHVTTHWNKALEKLTGYSAAEIVGTDKQWKAFRAKDHSLRATARPLMADAILDQFEAGEINRYYKKWRVSSLIEGAFEAEEFFAHFGENGKWCFFTAAPIKGPEGDIIGAIETLWDITEAKKAEQERERHTRELSTLCSIYSALN
ncbi:MAG: PAS domain-containing protein, partial [Desulfobacterales bacterium]|nr:PAS domain-containing protein [Desulfobacterales bacterium]